MYKKYIPSSPLHNINTCSEIPQCPPPYTRCDSECDQYTYEFIAPAIIYTNYDYPPYTPNCKECKHLQTELVYSIYKKETDGSETYINDWVIENRDTKNTLNITDCGNYVLRFCSIPPKNCFPQCIHPEPPIFYIDNSCCNSYIDTAKGEFNPIFKPFDEFILEVPKCCYVKVFLAFNSHEEEFELFEKKTDYVLNSGEFCELIKSIRFETNEECMKEITVIVKRKG